MTLEDKVAPEHTAVVAIDVQHDFCSPGGYMDREGLPLDHVDAMLPNLVDLLQQARTCHVPRIIVQASYASDGKWFLSPAWLERAQRVNRAGGHVNYPVCEEGSLGFELVTGIRGADDTDEIVIKKHRYSAFVDTELDLILRSRGIKTVITAGVATNVCVESTARDAFMRDYYVVMPADCCATYSLEEHDAALSTIDRYFGEVVSSGDVVAAWSRAHATRNRLSVADAPPLGASRR